MAEYTDEELELLADHAQLAGRRFERAHLLALLQKGVAYFSTVGKKELDQLPDGDVPPDLARATKATMLAGAVSGLQWVKERFTLSNGEIDPGEQLLEAANALARQLGISSVVELRCDCCGGRFFGPEQMTRCPRCLGHEHQDESGEASKAH